MGHESFTMNDRTAYADTAWVAIVVYPNDPPIEPTFRGVIDVYDKFDYRSIADCVMEVDTVKFHCASNNNSKVLFQISILPNPGVQAIKPSTSSYIYDYQFKLHSHRYRVAAGTRGDAIIVALEDDA